MGPDAQASLVRLHELARTTSADDLRDGARLGELARLVRGTSAAGASADQIAASGGLSMVWVRSVLDQTDEPVRDRLGRTLWVL